MSKISTMKQYMDVSEKLASANQSIRDLRKQKKVLEKKVKMPYWLVKSYVELYAKFKTKEFDLKMAQYVLGVKTRMVIMELRWAGYLKVKQDKNDKRKYFYQLQS